MKQHIISTHTREAASLVLTKVAASYGIAPNDMLVGGRLHVVVEPRQIVAYILRNAFKMQLKDIGYLLGGYDHTTIIYSCCTVRDRMDTESEYRGRVNELIAAFTNQESIFLIAPSGANTETS